MKVLDIRDTKIRMTWSLPLSSSLIVGEGLSEQAWPKHNQEQTELPNGDKLNWLSVNVAQGLWPLALLLGLRNTRLDFSTAGQTHGVYFNLTNLTTPQPPIRGSMECFPCNSERTSFPQATTTLNISIVWKFRYFMDCRERKNENYMQSEPTI